jgi:O-antigen/teichoic acid export membrane protein
MTLFDVIFSVFSSAKNDLQQIKNIYLKSIKLIALLSFPILSTIMIGSELIINGIYGEKWSGAIRVLQILSIAGFFRVITNSAGAVAKATRKVYEEAWRQLIFALILIIGALIGIKYGIEGVGFAVVISSLWFYISMAHLTISIVNITWSDFLKVQIPGILVFIIITIVNLATIITLNYFLGLEMYLFKLLILFLISSMALLGLLKTLPVGLIGDDGRNLITLYFEKLKSLSKRGIEYVDFF